MKERRKKAGRQEGMGRRENAEKMVNQVRDRDGLTEEEFLAAYRPGDYVRPSVAADMVIFTVTDRNEENYRKIPEKELRILLIKRVCSLIKK